MYEDALQRWSPHGAPSHATINAQVYSTNRPSVGFDLGHNPSEVMASLRRIFAVTRWMPGSSNLVRTANDTAPLAFGGGNIAYRPFATAWVHATNAGGARPTHTLGVRNRATTANVERITFATGSTAWPLQQGCSKTLAFCFRCLPSGGKAAFTTGPTVDGQAYANIPIDVSPRGILRLGLSYTLFDGRTATDEFLVQIFSEDSTVPCEIWILPGFVGGGGVAPAYVAARLGRLEAGALPPSPAWPTALADMFVTTQGYLEDVPSSAGGALVPSAPYTIQASCLAALQRL